MRILFKRISCSFILSSDDIESKLFSTLTYTIAAKTALLSDVLDYYDQINEQCKGLRKKIRLFDEMFVENSVTSLVNALKMENFHVENFSFDHFLMVSKFHLRGNFEIWLLRSLCNLTLTKWRFHFAYFFNIGVDGKNKIWRGNVCRAKTKTLTWKQKWVRTCWALQMKLPATPWILYFSVFHKQNFAKKTDPIKISSYCSWY